MQISLLSNFALRYLFLPDILFSRLILTKTVFFKSMECLPIDLPKPEYIPLFSIKYCIVRAVKNV